MLNLNTRISGRKRVRVALLLLVTVATAACSDTTATLAVPQGPPPVIDGVIGEGEWEAATTDVMSDGATIHFMWSDDILYVAVARDEIGAVNVVIGNDSEVLILHSSAALGSARYVPTRTTWELDHGFSWCCRNPSEIAARAELFDSEGWEANIGPTGDPGIVEYAIALPWDGRAIVISSIDQEENVGFWPGDLPDAAREQLLGPPPPRTDFDLDEWPTLTQGT